MNNHEIIEAITQMKIQLALLAENVNYLKYVVIACIIPTALGAWDNHKKSKALTKFLGTGEK